MTGTGRVRRRAIEAAGAGLAVLTGSTAGALAGAEPFSTWYYPLAWASTLLVIDAAVALRDGRFFFLARPAFVATLAAWSIPFWLVFELFNFRLHDWYYVFVPGDPRARWCGFVLSYATVLPAILGGERTLDALGFGHVRRTRGFRVTRRSSFTLQVVGAALLALALAWPRLLFPLVWGGVTLVADPWVWRRAPERSLLGDLAAGRPGRVVRLLLAGLAIGVLWETYNLGARGKWIYTVPGLDGGAPFEMPWPGFLGFPVFALDGFAAWQALVVAGLAVPARGPARAAPRLGRVAAALGAAAFAGFVLAGMGRSTIASVTPSLADVPGLPTARFVQDGWDVFDLAEASPDAVARATGADSARAGRWIDAARLVTLRGIGGPAARRLRAAGVRSVAALAASDPATLTRRLASGGRSVDSARVRTWIRAAREAGR